MGQQRRRTPPIAYKIVQERALASGYGDDCADAVQSMSNFWLLLSDIMQRHIWKD